MKMKMQMQTEMEMKMRTMRVKMSMKRSAKSNRKGHLLLSPMHEQKNDKKNEQMKGWMTFILKPHH